MSLTQTPTLLPRRRQAPTLPVLMHRVHNPIDPWVRTNGFVLGVHENDFEVLVRGVLVDPVGV